MAEAVHIQTDAEKKAVEKLRSPQPGFGLFRARVAEEERQREEAEVRKVVADNDIGHVMSDGTVYAGISPDTNSPLFAAPSDAALLLDFNEASKCAAEFEVGGKKDFRIPKECELHLLFENRERGALKGTFNLSGTRDGGGWYWSDKAQGAAEIYTAGAFCQDMRDGVHGSDHKSSTFSARFVRG